MTRLLRSTPSTWRVPLRDIPRDVCHIIKRGERSFCGAVSRHRFGWAIVMAGAVDPAGWEAVQPVAPNALCADCCRRARALDRVPGVWPKPLIGAARYSVDGVQW